MLLPKILLVSIEYPRYEISLHCHVFFASFSLPTVMNILPEFNDQYGTKDYWFVQQSKVMAVLLPASS